VREEAHEELVLARELLGSLAARADFRTLTGTPVPRLARWSAEEGFDLIFLPATRLERRGGRRARQLRRATHAEVRLIR
jgi:hypothetical protein